MRGLLGSSSVGREGRGKGEGRGVGWASSEDRHNEWVRSLSHQDDRTLKLVLRR